MALLTEKNLKKLEKTRNTIHQQVQATYTVFEKNEERLFQIDTYGSPNREMPEKISQSIQFDKKMAKYLIQLLSKEFNL